MNIYKLVLVGGLILSPDYASALVFTDFASPKLVGQRSASVVIDFEERASPSARVRVRYTVEGSPEPGTIDATFSPITGSPNKVKATVNFPHPGNIIGAAPHINGGERVNYRWIVGIRESEEKTFVTPRRIRIAIIGDSYMAGEGAPNRKKGDRVTAEDMWDDVTAHRSANSGGEIAIRKLRLDRKDLHIARVNATCSGATLSDFLTPDIRDEESKNGHPFLHREPQLQSVKDWLGSYTDLDILLADGGGNDCYFATLLEDLLNGCLGGPTGASNVSENQEVRARVSAALDKLPTTFQTLADNVKPNDSGLNTFGFAVNRVLWVNYPLPRSRPNPGHSPNPLPCGPIPIPWDCWGLLECWISEADWNFAINDLYLPLNRIVGQQVRNQRWSLIDVSNRGLTHGMCNCSDPYLNTYGRSQETQGDEFGTCHPNKKGYEEIYLQPIYDGLLGSINSIHQERQAVLDAKAEAIAEAKAKAKREAAAKAWKKAMGLDGPPLLPVPPLYDEKLQTFVKANRQLRADLKPQPPTKADLTASPPPGKPTLPSDTPRMLKDSASSKKDTE